MPVTSPLTPHLTPELTVADRRQKREIRQLEQELHKWQVLVDSITGEESGGPASSRSHSLHHTSSTLVAGLALPSTPRPVAPFPQGILAWFPAFHSGALL